MRRRGFLAGLLSVPLSVLAGRPHRRTGVYRDIYFDDYARY